MALTRILGSFKDAILTNVVSSSAQIASDVSGSIVGGVSGSVASTGSFGSIYIDKNVNASAFVGDGSSLTGIDIPTAAAISGSIVGGVSGSATSTGSFGRVEAAGDVELKAGNLVISTHGKGIDFSANTDDAGGLTSEILDDYEEGTWTASITDGTDAAIMDGSYQTGNYVKIGRLVTVTGRLGVTDVTNVDDVQIQGLPFTVEDTSGAWSICPMRGWNLDITAGQNWVGQIAPNDTYILICAWDDAAGAPNPVTGAELSSDGSLIFGASYVAAS
jgi:hypothetical protein